jgi:hypothetical protein
MRLGRWKHWFFFLLVAPAASLAAYHLGSLTAFGLKQKEQSFSAATINGLYIQPQSLDLGEVWETPDHSFRLTIQNVGKQTRSISRFQTTCGCLQLDPPGRTIAPGEKAEFNAHLDLMHRLPYQIGLAQWPKVVRIDPVFEGDLTATLGWEMKAVVRSRVSTNRMQIPFADRCSSDGDRVWSKVRATAHVPLKCLQATVRPNYAATRIESNPASPEDYFIFVSPNPSLPLGAFRFEVRLRAVTLDDVSHDCATIEAFGVMQPASRVLPRVVLLGEHTIPSEAVADVNLKLPSSRWHIDHLETDSTETLVTQAEGETKESPRLHITQRIMQPGDGVSRIRIVVRKPNKELEIVTVEVRYYGQNGHR